MIMHFRIANQRGEVLEYRKGSVPGEVQRRIHKLPGGWSRWVTIRSRNPEFSWPAYVTEIKANPTYRFEVIREEGTIHA